MKLSKILKNIHSFLVSDTYKDEFRIREDGNIFIKESSGGGFILNPDECPMVFWSVITSWLFCDAVFKKEWKHFRDRLVEMRKSGTSLEATMNYIESNTKI